MRNLKPTDPWLLKVLALIRTRPGMWIGSEEVRTLDAYLLAYQQARGDLNVPELNDDELKLWTEFEPWLRKRLGLEVGAHSMGWAWYVEQEFLKQRRQDKLPTYYNGSRTYGSCKLFFVYFDEYLESKGLTYPEVLRPAEPEGDR